MIRMIDNDIKNLKEKYALALNLKKLGHYEDAAELFAEIEEETFDIEEKLSGGI